MIYRLALTVYEATETKRGKRCKEKARGKQMDARRGMKECKSLSRSFTMVN